MSKLRSRRGSSAVFLCMVLATLVAISLGLIYSAREYGAASRVNAVSELAMQSVLSEFDYDVQKDYGIFLIRGSNDELRSCYLRYLNHSLKTMKDADVSDIRVSCGAYNVSDVSLVRDQILEYMKYAEVKGLAEMFTGKNDVINNLPERELNHGPTRVSLPSRSLPAKSLLDMAEGIGNSLSDIQSALSEGTEKYLLGSYIMKHFNNCHTLQDDTHFFRNEVEYILAGKYTDKKNADSVERALKAMRIPLNLAHIYSDPEKQALILAAAEATSGPFAGLTQLVIATTWAYAESDNDVNLLREGYKVPITKDKASWATDLDGIASAERGAPFKPEVNTGLTYEQYLQILLYFRDDNLKTARIMDLIQINMRKKHDGGFVINEYSTGITVSINVNGKTYRNEKKY